MEAWRYELYARIRYQNSLFHSGRLGMRWGVRNGPPYPLDKKQFSAAEKKAASKTSGKEGSKTKRKKTNKAFDKGKNTFTRYSDVAEKDIRSASYMSSSTNDRNMYRDDAFMGVLGGKKADEIYEMTIKAHGDVKVADVNESLNEIMTNLDKKWLKFSYQLDALDTYKKLKDAGFFDQTKSVDDRFDITVKILGEPKINDPKGNVAAYEKRKNLAETIHKEIYKDRKKFVEKYRTKGYDAIIDPEDFVYVYDRPYIVANPDKFYISNTKKLTRIKDKPKKGK